MNQPHIARAEAYRSFARLFLFEPEQRELRVEFTRLFTLNVFPYASVFLDEEALLNTETTARVQAAYETAGFELDCAWLIGAPDHFGVELFFVTYLLETKRTDAANTFLRDEVAPWAGIYLHAVEKNAQEDFYRDLARKARTYLLNDGAPLHSHFNFPVLPKQLPDEDDLDTVVTHLIIPSRAGIFLSKDDISAIARTLDLPVSFGDRALMLKSLFRSGGEYDRIELLLCALQAETDNWIKRFATDAREYPPCAQITRVWLNRVEATLARLQTMEQEIKRDGI